VTIMVKITAKRGSILVQVLVGVMLLAAAAVSVLRIRIQPALASARGVARIGEDLSARAAINRVNESWARLGVCSSDSAAGISCTGSGNNCSCKVGGVTVCASPGADCVSYKLTVSANSETSCPAGGNTCQRPTPKPVDPPKDACYGCSAPMPTVCGQHTIGVDSCGKKCERALMVYPFGPCTILNF